MKTRVFYEIVRTVPVTRGINRDEMLRECRTLNESARHGAVYSVREVKAVTRPFRVVGDEEGESD